jgi:hypothetical protein
MNIKFCKLENPEHKLPMPDRGGRLFSADGERVNIEDPFYRLCLQQGCISVSKAVRKSRSDETVTGNAENEPGEQSSGKPRQNKTPRK